MSHNCPIFFSKWPQKSHICPIFSPRKIPYFPYFFQNAQWAAWLDYNHLHAFGKSLHQREYKVLRKGLDAGLSKQQISNLSNSQEALGNISPLTAIERFSGVRNGKIRADFYDDCQDIPRPSALDPTQKNMLLLDDCFQANRIKQKRTTLEVGTTIAIRYTLHKTISDYLDIQLEKNQTLLSCSHKT